MCTSAHAPANLVRTSSTLQDTTAEVSCQLIWVRTRHCMQGERGSRLPQMGLEGAGLEERALTVPPWGCICDNPPAGPRALHQRMALARRRHYIQRVISNEQELSLHLSISQSVGGGREDMRGKKCCEARRGNVGIGSAPDGGDGAVVVHVQQRDLLRLALQQHDELQRATCH